MIGSFPILIRTSFIRARENRQAEGEEERVLFEKISGKAGFKKISSLPNY
jgi:hypothetical protein